MISVVIPVKDGGSDLLRCLAGIASQHVDEEVEVVVIDSGSVDGSPDRARDTGAVVVEIPEAEFGHGSTRNLGVRTARGELLVFTSQDAVAADERWLATLATAARSGPEVAGAYGRQLPHPDARPPEQFFLDFLYGPAARVQRLAPGEALTFEATLFSNVNAAIPRPVLDTYPFRDDLTMSEDQEWSRRVLRDGLTSRLRATRNGVPLARVHDPQRVQAVLRLGRVRRALLRRRGRSPAPRSGGRAGATPARRSRGSGGRAAAAGFRMPPCTRQASSPGSSSGCATVDFRIASSRG